MFVSYSYPRFDCKLNASLFDLHGPSFVSSRLYKSAFIVYMTKPVPKLRCHFTQGSRQGNSCPLDTYLVRISLLLILLKC